MARQPRIEYAGVEYAGAFYHVMARGDRREAIITSEADRENFLATMGRACTKTGWRIHAWVLMTNRKRHAEHLWRSRVVDVIA